MDSLRGRWGFEFDPFEGAEARRLVVPVPPQSRACMELRGMIARAERLVRVVGPAGVGKSTVLTRVLAEHRGPHCRVARVAGAFDAAELYGRLADALRRERHGGPREDAATAWRRLVEALRLCRVQELAVVVAIDEGDAAIDALAHLRLARLDQAGGLDVTILLAQASAESDLDDAPLVVVQPMTRAEAWDYLSARTEAAGGPRGFWSREAATRLHALSRGLPRALDRLAARALREALDTGELVIDDETPQAALPFAMA
jgi:type II secretory pathway predicted ATPase ExeA